MRIAKLSPRSHAALWPDRWLWVFLLILAFGAGFLVAHLGWYHWLGTFGATLLENPRSAFDAWRYRVEIPTLTVDLDFASYQQLAARRERALQTGANLASEMDAVPATLAFDAVPVDVMLRLPETTVAALSGDRWPFEFTARAGQSLSDVSRGTLVPVDEHTRFDQLYLMMLRSADIPVAEHHYVDLVVNGAHWGFYGLETLPSTEWLVARGFSSGSVVVFFDQHDYLVAPPASPVGSFAYARIVVARAAGGTREAWAQALTDDPSLAAIRADVVHNLRALEQGDAAPSDLFDADVLGRMLAITTFWQGSSELDWRTICLAYDPATQHFTPIGTAARSVPALSLPVAFTDDPIIQRTYVQMLKNLSDRQFLETMQRTWDAERLRLADAVVVDSSPALADVLADRQSQVRALLSPSRTLFARGSAGEGALLVRLDALLPYPVEVLGFDFSERGFLPLDSAWVTPRMGGSLVDVEDSVVVRARVTDAPVAIDVRVPLSALPVELLGTPDELRVVTRIWGLDNEIAVPMEWGGE